MSEYLNQQHLDLNYIPIISIPPVSSWAPAPTELNSTVFNNCLSLKCRKLRCK